MQNIKGMFGSEGFQEFAALEFYRNHRGNLREQILRSKQPVTWETLARAMRDAWLAQPDVIKGRYILHGRVAHKLWIDTKHDRAYRPLTAAPPVVDTTGCLLIDGEPFQEQERLNIIPEFYCDFMIHMQLSHPMVYPGGPRRGPPTYAYWPDPLF
ncbi:hypothetical protein NMY22_g16706 [Coprinellus aureogranulatus]|nr:hypothetical protein NMY22_g16706 [Coprinellus aureogranulatus]